MSSDLVAREPADRRNFRGISPQTSRRRSFSFFFCLCDCPGNVPFISFFHAIVASVRSHRAVRDNIVGANQSCPTIRGGSAKKKKTRRRTRRKTTCRHDQSHPSKRCQGGEDESGIERQRVVKRTNGQEISSTPAPRLRLRT